MKRHLGSIIALLCLLLTYRAGAQTTEITQQDAFNQVRKLFEGRDVDYYTATLKTADENNNSWTFFVDAAPMALWEHECYIVHVPKYTSQGESENNINSEELSCPPQEYDMSPFLTKNRREYTEAEFPFVETPTPNGNNDATFLGTGGQTYAIILSGNSSIDKNYIEFWNDCSFMYQTLVKKYNIPKDNISVLISDGTDPANDMVDLKKKPMSSPLDLDRDGEADIQYAATKANLNSVLSGLKAKLNKNDQFFLFIDNHGGVVKDGSQEVSYVSLWNKEVLYANELKDMLFPFINDDVFVNIVIGSCKSGGFLEHLEYNGCVIATSTEKHLYAYVSTKVPYTKFMYHWICAVNGADAKNGKVDADYDDDGVVSMAEASRYAKYKTEKEQNIHVNSLQYPQYQSIPRILGEELAFNRAASPIEDYDLCIRDNDLDYFSEPNVSTDIYWNSPDIWINNKAFALDTTVVHENPYYAEGSHICCKVYVRVHNRSTDTYTHGKSVRLYWAQASTKIDPNTWRGKTISSGDSSKLGGYIGDVQITKIQAGKSEVFDELWTLPKELYQVINRPDNHYYCIFAQIVDDKEDTDTCTFDALSSKRMAQTNISYINKEDSVKSASVFFSNIYPSEQAYSMELRCHSSGDDRIYNYANIAADLSPTFFYSWYNRGNGQGCELVPYDRSPYCIQFLSTRSKMENIRMVSNGLGRVTMYFDFFDAPFYQQTYTLDLIQRDKDGVVIGGETFVIESPVKTFYSVQADSINAGNGVMNLSSITEPDNSVNWYTADNKFVSSGKTLSLTPKMRGNQYTMVITTPDGELSKETIYTQHNIGIEKITPSGSITDYIEIEMFDENISGYNIAISSLPDGNMLYTKDLGAGENNVYIDLSSFAKGLYVISCTLNGELLNSHKFNIVR